MKKLEGRIITENPLRILGVYSDTPKKEIVANLGKLRAFAKTGKTLSFDSDFTSLLGPVNRTLEAIEKANNNIALAKDRIQSSLFWFNFDSIQNKDVFTSLNSGDVDSAIMTLRYDFTPAALVNSAVCFLIRRKWSNTLYCYSQLFDDNRYESYLNSIIGQGGGISKRDIIDIIICSLYSYYPEVDWVFYSKAKRIHYGEEAIEIGTRLSSSEFVKVLYAKRVDLIRNKIHSIIDEVEKKNLDNPDDCLNAIKEIDFLSSEFDNLEKIIPKKDSRYSFLANKVANLLNSLCFKYFYNSNDYKKAKTILPYTKRAYLLACSDEVIEICKKGFLYVSSKVDELPPEIIDNAKAEFSSQLSSEESSTMPQVDSMQSSNNTKSSNDNKAYGYVKHGIYYKIKSDNKNKWHKVLDIMCHFSTKDLPKYLITFSVLYLYYLLCRHFDYHWTIKLGCIIPTTLIFWVLAKYLPPKNYDGPIEITGQYEGGGFEMWNGFGVDVVGHFGHPDHIYSSNYDTKNPPHRSYVFFFLWIPLIPIDCISVSQGETQSTGGYGTAEETKTSYRIYGTCKWSILEVIYLYLFHFSWIAVVIDLLYYLGTFIDNLKS